MRIDRLLCYLRFVRTRSAAHRLVDEGHIRRNGERVTRASRDILEGDVLTLPLGNSVRLVEIIALPERRGAPREEMSGGTHGWDNEDPQMQALFIAAGPRISATTPVRNLENVDVYALLAALVGVSPQPNDGDEDALVLFAACAP